MIFEKLFKNIFYINIIYRKSKNPKNPKSNFHVSSSKYAVLAHPHLVSIHKFI